jgi:hypothetical protein
MKSPFVVLKTVPLSLGQVGIADATGVMLEEDDATDDDVTTVLGLGEALEEVGAGAGEEELELATDDETAGAEGELLEELEAGAGEEELELGTKAELEVGQDVKVIVLVEVVGCVTCTVRLEVTALPVCVTVTVEAGRGAAVVDAIVFEVTNAVCVTMAAVGAGPNCAVNGIGLWLPATAPR